MIAIGLVLLVLALIVGAGVVLGNDQLVSAEAFGVSVNDISLGVFFLIGAAVGAVVLLGLALMIAGAGRSRTKKKAVREQEEDSRVRHESLAEQNSRLQSELEASRAADGGRGVDGDHGRDGKQERAQDSDRSGDASSERTTVQERPVTPARRDSGEPTWSPTTSPGAAPGVAAGTGPAAAAAPAVAPVGAAPTPTVLPADSADGVAAGGDGPGKHVADDKEGDGRPDRN